jgi:hypothetical protein
MARLERCLCSHGAAAVAVRDVSTQVRDKGGEVAAHGTYLQEPSSWQSPRKRQGM